MEEFKIITEEERRAQRRTRLDKLTEGSTKIWTSKNPKVYFNIVEHGPDIRYIVTAHFEMSIVKYERRGKNWKWVSIENIHGHVKKAEEVKGGRTRSTCLAMRKHFKKIDEK